MNQMKQLLFESAAKEHYLYLTAVNEKESREIQYVQQQRYDALFKVIRLAGMGDEFRHWLMKLYEKGDAVGIE